MAGPENPSDNPFESERPDMPSLGNPGAMPPPYPPIEEELPEGTPGVAAAKGKAFFVLGVVGVIVLVLMYNIIFGGKKEDKKPEVKEMKVAKPIDAPVLPELEPEVMAPPPTIMPPSIPEPMDLPEVTDISPLSPKEDSAAKAQAMARTRSNMVISSGSGSSLSDALGGGSDAPAPGSLDDPNAAFANAVGRTKVETVKATRIGNLRRTIAQGRIIQATMESALNTDLPAPIRAIVSRDTYAEAGNTPLIPKGSRLIGSYNTGVLSGQTRVFVVWTRVIRPDGVDVMLGSPLVDQIGQAGVTGQIDTKFQEIFSRALLASVINIATAIGSDEITGGTTTTTTSAQGGSQTTGDAATTATSDALNRLGSITDSFIQKFIAVKPTVLVDQGTAVNVFVNKDLIFPSDGAGTQIVN